MSAIPEDIILTYADGLEIGEHKDFEHNGKPYTIKYVTEFGEKPQRVRMYFLTNKSGMLHHINVYVDEGFNVVSHDFSHIRHRRKSTSSKLIGGARSRKARRSRRRKTNRRTHK